MTALRDDISAETAVIRVTAPLSNPTYPFFRSIDSETIKVTSGADGTEWQVERGIGDTEAAPHGKGAALVADTTPFGSTGGDAGEQTVYVQTTDPGAVGAGKLWVDTTDFSLPVIRYRNVDDDNWFDLMEAYRGLGTVELQTLDAMLRLRRYNADGSVVRAELATEAGDTRIRAFDEASTLIAEWEVSTDGWGGLIADEIGNNRVTLESAAGASEDTDARYSLVISDAASVEKAKILMDETGLHFEGANVVEVPATPTEQDIVDALLALGLVTQAAP